MLAIQRLTVTILEDSEKKVSNRGSKSNACLNSLTSHNQAAIVKEQRVDGSCFGGNSSRLRCTLMGFERGHHIKNLSGQLFQYSTAVSTNLSEDSVLDPWFITGFT